MTNCVLEGFRALPLPIPIMNSSCSRILLASPVKSLSEDTMQNPSTEPECSRSMASMIRKLSVAFLPALVDFSDQITKIGSGKFR